MSTLVIPDPALVVLIGAAGSGKSTFAATRFASDEILSSDALRAAVSGNEADQAASAVAFRILHRTLERRLAGGRLTVVDATNTRPQHRRPLLARARAAGVATVAVVLDLPPDHVHAQNAGRTGRVVDRDVVDRQLTAVRRTLDAGQLIAEGFLHVAILRSARDVASLDVVRRTQPPAATAPTTRPNARARNSTQTPLRR
jgi:protein phosphatase